MASKFHINPSTGDAGACRARAGRCPFGSEDLHFSSLEAARNAYETVMESEEFSALSRRKVGDWPDLERVRASVNSEHSVYVNSDGSLAVHRVSMIDVYDPKGKKLTGDARTAAVGAIQSNASGWTVIKEPQQPLPSREAYDAEFFNKSTQKLRAKETANRERRIRREGARAIFNEEAHYPADTRLDASQELTTSSKLSADSSGSSTVERIGSGNPHTATELAGVYEIWSNYDGYGQERVIAVETQADKVHELESTTNFESTSSRRIASLDNAWTLKGAFEGKEGGGTLGWVPNSEIPVFKATV